MKTTDLCDEHIAKLRVLEPGLSHFGGRKAFSGPIATLKTLEDNTRVRELLEQPGKGRVLVVDGQGSKRCALLGDMLAALAIKNGWAGVVINGCVRDTAELATLPLGVCALAAHPKKSAKNGAGELGARLLFAGVEFQPGDYLYADEDGIVLSREPLTSGS